MPFGGRASRITYRYPLGLVEPCKSLYLACAGYRTRLPTTRALGWRASLSISNLSKFEQLSAISIARSILSVRATTWRHQ